MVTFVTGSVDAGKTAYIRNQSDLESDGYGLLTQKIFDSGTFIGYNLVLLPSGEEYPFIYKKENANSPMLNNVIDKGRFIFLQNTFELANRYLIDNLDKYNKIWIDEAGSLELQGSGFDPALQQILKTNKDVIITTKERLISPLVHYYNIQNYSVIKIE